LEPRKLKATGFVMFVVDVIISGTPGCPNQRTVATDTAKAHTGIKKESSNQMGIKAIKPGDKKIDVTHVSDVIFQDETGETIATVFDENVLNENFYKSLEFNKNIEMSIDPMFITNTSEGSVFLISIKIRTLDDYKEYIIRPNQPFIEAFMSSGSLAFAIKIIPYSYIFPKVDTDGVKEMLHKISSGELK